MKNLSQISVILMKNLSHFGHLRLAGMRRRKSPSFDGHLKNTKIAHMFRNNMISENATPFSHLFNILFHSVLRSAR